MSKRKTVIELQTKPENKGVRRLIERTKPVEFASINPLISKMQVDDSAIESETNDDKEVLEIEQNKASQMPVPKRLEKTSQTLGNEEDFDKSVNILKSNGQFLSEKGLQTRESEKAAPVSSPVVRESPAQIERLRIFQASTPVNRTSTKFQKAAIVVRGENGKQLVELLWRDQMNEKTRDIWDFLCKKFLQAAELETNEVLIRKRDILQGSGVKSDRTFISAVYTLEDMGLIEVRRLSGNKEGNVYILTEEGREEIDAYQSSGM